MITTRLEAAKARVMDAVGQYASDLVAAANVVDLRLPPTDPVRKLLMDNSIKSRRALLEVLEAEFKALQPIDIELRIRANGMYGLLSEISAAGVLYDHDRDLAQRVIEAIKDHEANRSAS